MKLTALFLQISRETHRLMENNNNIPLKRFSPQCNGPGFNNAIKSQKIILA